MLYSNDRDELRRMYREAWRKAASGEPMSALEAQIAAVVEEHPEYHRSVTSASEDADFSPDSGQTNPFLHMGLHLALRDQVKTGRPPGIRAVHDRLCAIHGDRHAAEHAMIECLAETLWEAQRRNALPDEQRYLERVRQLLR